MENYSLAFTQHKKNKDIPEGGAKSVIFLDPTEFLETEKQLHEKELFAQGLAEEEVSKKIKVILNETKDLFSSPSPKVFY